MLSYRHSFHAGNHADVLKHLTLKLVLDYYNKKEKPYWYIDTHSGAGLYNLEDAHAQKTGESTQGILRLNNTPPLSNELNLFLSFIRSFKSEKEQSLYPGSPLIAQALLRNQDHLKLFELHPTDFEYLVNNFANYPKKRVYIEKIDGFKGLIALLPPSTKRAVILIDPPYEEKSDYQKVITVLQQAYQRFQTGCYIIWYPILTRKESGELPKKLAQIFSKSYLNTEIIVHSPRPDGFGMHGSGLFIINPPYLLAEQLEKILPELTTLLGQDATAHFNFKIQIE